MVRIVSGIFIILHGLVHLWYVVLSQRLVAFQPDMGWSGESWLLSGIVEETVLRPFASGLFVLATLGFLASGVGILAQGDWWRPVLLGAAVLSLVTLVVFWDGSRAMLVQKGLLGVLIDAGIIVFVLVRGI